MIKLLHDHFQSQLLRVFNYKIPSSLSCSTIVIGTLDHLGHAPRIRHLRILLVIAY